jgi:hypothetical protein
MADQAAVNVSKPASSPEAGRNGAPEARLVGGLAEFGNDIATLAELQYKLAMADLSDCIRRALVPAAMVVVGLFLVVGSIPVLLLGVAQLVAVALKIGLGWAMVLTGGVALATALLVVWICVRLVRPSFSSFRRSREEQSRNLAWIRTVLLYSGRSVPRRGR